MMFGSNLESLTLNNLQQLKLNNNQIQILLSKLSNFKKLEHLSITNMILEETAISKESFD